MPDKNLLGLALLQQNGYVDVPVLLGFNVMNIAALKTYPMDIPPSRNIRNIYIEIGGGLTPQYISEMRLKPNGLPTMTIPFSILDTINQYYNEAVSGPDANGTYRIDLAQVRQLLLGGSSYINFEQKLFYSGAAGDMMEATTLNCGSPDPAAQNKQINLLKLEVDVDNYTVNNTGFINILVLAGPPWEGGPGQLKTIFRNTVTIGAGPITLTKNTGLLYGDKLYTSIDALHLVPPDDGAGAFAIFQDFQLWYNNNIVRQRSDEMNRKIQVDNFVRTPQANLYSLDFTETGLGDKSLPTGDPNTSMYLKFNASNPAGKTPLPGVMEVIQYGTGSLW